MPILATMGLKKIYIAHDRWKYARKRQPMA